MFIKYNDTYYNTDNILKVSVEPLLRNQVVVVIIFVNGKEDRILFQNRESADELAVELTKPN